MSDLVKRLCEGDHPVEITIRPERTALAVKECIDRGYVHVKFTGTRGGTELGVRLTEDTDTSAADFERQTGSVKLVGNLTLDYVPVTCVACVDLQTWSGSGHLKLVSTQP